MLAKQENEKGLISLSAFKGNLLLLNYQTVLSNSEPDQ